MIEAKGTLEEWEKFAEKVGHIYQVNTGMKIKDAIIIAARNDGFITKPEWEQAYDAYNNIPEGVFCPKQAKNAISIMHDRIVELEKIVREGK